MNYSKYFSYLALILFIVFGICFFTYSYDDKSVYQLLREANSFIDSGKYVEAESLCKEVLEINPEVYHAYNLLGLIYSKREGYERKAISYFQKSIEIRPKQIEIYNNISSLYNKLDKIDESLPYIEQGLSYNPGDFQLNFNAGITYLLFKQDPKSAINYLVAALGEKPDYDKLLYLVGVSYLLTKEKVMALEFVTELRRVENEYLAWELEEAIRRTEEGEVINMSDVLKTYSSQPKKKNINQGVSKESSTVRVKPKTKVGATGKITLKTTIQKKEEN